jgi:ubiquinone/menaquinone biosynthesis C-methylase UbiE
VAKIKINSNKENVHIGLVEELGQVQFEIFPKVKNAVELFKSQDVKDIIDLGCGLGWNTIFLAREGFNIWAGDICKGYIDTLRDKTSKMNLKNINCKQLDMKNIPYEDNSFDAVICTSTLNHGTLREIKMIIDEIHRVLKPNGILITDLLSVEDQSFGIGEMIETNTFIGGRKGEEDIPHHYTDENEIMELFKSFKEVYVYRRNYIFDLADSEVMSQVYDIECVK